jgi:hypothetical protein
MTESGRKAAFKDISNWKWFVLVAILLRGSLWLYFGHLVNVHLPADQKIYSHFVKDDYMFFFDPVDNFFRTGTFGYYGNVPFTGRMPGYSTVYFLFRLIFSQQIAAHCVIGLQFLLSSISVYVLALTSYKIFESRRAFYITYCLYVLAVFPGFFDFIIVAESFSVSALIFVLFFLTRYIKEGNRTKDLILSGTFLAWTIFLREYTGLLIAVIPTTLVAYHFLSKKDGFVKAVKAGVLFCIPFIVADTAWTIRNYIGTGKIIPIASADVDTYGKLYSSSWNAIEDLVYTWGENGAPFDKNGLAFYYRTPSVKTNFKFPDRLFNGVTTYNADSLVHLRQLYANYYYTTDTTVEHINQKKIEYLCALYKNDYITHNHFAYWVVKPIKDLKYLMFFSGTGYLPMPPFSQCNVLEKGIKLVFTVLYFIIIICSIAGIICYFLFKRGRDFMPWLMLISCVSIAGILIMVSILQEPRYSVHIFMMLVLFASYFIDKVLLKRVKQLEN